MHGPMREIAFSQTHRRTHRQRNIVVSQFDPNNGDGFPAGLAWHYVLRTGDDGPWTVSRRIPIPSDETDDAVIQTVVRYLAGPGWYRDAVVTPVR